MNQGHLRDPLCYLCPHGAVVSSLSLAQEVVCPRLTFYKTIVNEFTLFSESHFGKNRYYFAIFCITHVGTFSTGLFHFVFFKIHVISGGYNRYMVLYSFN